MKPVMLSNVSVAEFHAGPHWSQAIAIIDVAFLPEAVFAQQIYSGLIQI